MKRRVTSVLSRDKISGKWQQNLELDLSRDTLALRLCLFINVYFNQKTELVGTMQCFTQLCLVFSSKIGR